MRQPRILVVEDECIVAEQLLGTLTRMGYETVPAMASGEEAIIAAVRSQPDLVLMDVELDGELTGVEAAREIRRAREIPVIFLTAYCDQDILTRIKSCEPYGYLVKPVDPEDLHVTIEVALTRRAADEKLEEAVRMRTKELAEKHEALRRELEERKAAEQALQESEWRYQRVNDFMLDMVSVVNNASDMIFIVMPDGTIRYGTPSIELQLQYEPPQVLGNNLAELLCPGERAEVMSVIADVMSTHATRSVTHCLKKKDGSMIAAESIVKFYIDQMNTRCALITSRDVTERKKADDALRALNEMLETRVEERTAQLAEANVALRQSEERYRRIIDAVTDYIYTVEVKDGSPVATTHHPACQKITGYTVDEFTENPYLWLQMVHPDDREAVALHAQHIVSGIDEPSIKHRIIRKDGTMHWVLNTSVPHKNEAGMLVSYDGVINEIA
ncbi:MAG TPA: PAS domain S-box protein [Bacteroidota bacterium]|nr:PAS domain S-box protein [Bacteroidota bacterium]